MAFWAASHGRQDTEFAKLLNMAGAALASPVTMLNSRRGRGIRQRVLRVLLCYVWSQLTRFKKWNAAGWWDWQVLNHHHVKQLAGWAHALQFAQQPWWLPGICQHGLQWHCDLHLVLHGIPVLDCLDEYRSFVVACFHNRNGSAPVGSGFQMAANVEVVKIRHPSRHTVSCFSHFPVYMKQFFRAWRTLRIGMHMTRMHIVGLVSCLMAAEPCPQV